ncbi:MAG: hypothetical protein LBJ01_11085 [Tannerella sp.]|nr:hypothetical protein [Tannerella sp.]
MQYSPSRPGRAIVRGGPSLRARRVVFAGASDVPVIARHEAIAKPGTDGCGLPALAIASCLAMTALVEGACT